MFGALDTPAGPTDLPCSGCARELAREVGFQFLDPRDLIAEGALVHP